MVSTMPWQVPKNLENYHPLKKFLFSRDALYRLHVAQGKNPREISELHEQLAGFTIDPQGVACYLQAHGFYRPQKPGMSQFKKVRKLGGTGSLYYYMPEHPAANAQGRVLYGRVIAEGKYGRLNFREWRIVYRDGNRLNCSFDNVTVVRTRKGQAAHLLREATERRLDDEEVGYIRTMARKEKFCFAALIFRLQLEMRSAYPELKSLGSSRLIRLLDTKYPWFAKRYKSKDDLRKVLAKSQRISVKAFRNYRLQLDRKIPVRYLRWEEKFGFIPLKLILREPVPDKYII